MTAAWILIVYSVLTGEVKFISPLPFADATECFNTAEEINKSEDLEATCTVVPRKEKT